MPHLPQLQVNMKLNKNGNLRSKLIKVKIDNDPNSA